MVEFYSVSRLNQPLKNSDGCAIIIKLVLILNMRKRHGQDSIPSVLGLHEITLESNFSIETMMQQQILLCKTECGICSCDYWGGVHPPSLAGLTSNCVLESTGRILLERRSWGSFYLCICLRSFTNLSTLACLVVDLYGLNLIRLFFEDVRWMAASFLIPIFLTMSWKLPSLGSFLFYFILFYDSIAHLCEV